MRALSLPFGNGVEEVETSRAGVVSTADKEMTVGGEEEEELPSSMITEMGKSICAIESSCCLQGEKKKENFRVQVVKRERERKESRFWLGLLLSTGDSVLNGDSAACCAVL